MFQYLRTVHTRACLKKVFCKMCVTICGRFRSDEGAVAGYGNRIPVKSLAKWGVQIAGMIFQTHSSKQLSILYYKFTGFFPETISFLCFTKPPSDEGYSCIFSPDLPWYNAGRSCPFFRWQASWRDVPQSA